MGNLKIEVRWKFWFKPAAFLVLLGQFIAGREPGIPRWMLDSGMRLMVKA